MELDEQLKAQRQQFESLLTEFALSKSEIAILLDADKKDEHIQVRSDWATRYNQHILDKPEVRAKFKDEFELSVGKEATRKSRKSISNELSLGLTNKQIDELTNDEFTAIVKEHGSKDVDKKIIDLEAQYKEEKRLRELAESEKESAIESVKSEFTKKDITREIQLRKANVLASKDSTKFNKSDNELIDYAIAGAEISQGVSFVTENGKVFVTKDGQKLRSKDNAFVEYENWLEPILSKFDIKQKGTPDGSGEDGKGNGEHKEKSAAVIRLENAYKAKGISVEATA